MKKKIKDNIGTLIGESINSYHNSILKETVDNLKFKEEYQNRIIDVMVGEVDDNYITTPETNEPITKLEYSKEGVIKIPSIKGRTILVDANGSETNTPAEGCKLLSVGEEEDNKLIILSNNLNLVNGMEIGGYSENGEKLNGSSHTQARCTEPIYIGDGGTFYAWMDKNGINDIGANGVWYHALDKNKQVVRSFNGYSKSYTLNKGEVYIIFRTHMQYHQYNNTFKMMISTSPIIKYIEPQSHKTEILLNNGLYSYDKIFNEIQGNKHIVRLKKLVLNGGENYTLNQVDGQAGKNNRIVFKLDYTTTKVNKCIINSLKTVSSAWSLNCLEDSIHFTTNGLYINLPYDKFKTVDDFKEYLKLYPIEIMYELEEPIIEELPNSITLQGFDDTTMYIENSITPTVTYGYNALIPYKQELSNQKEEVEINTLDIENNIIPYLMDIEFNLMTMEDK